jgi:hypothetical protein
MRLRTSLSKHLTDTANIQESNSVNYFNLCATIRKVRILEGTLQFGILVKKNSGRFHLKKHNFSLFIISGHPVYIPQYFPNMQ